MVQTALSVLAGGGCAYRGDELDLLTPNERIARQRKKRSILRQFRAAAVANESQEKSEITSKERQAARWAQVHKDAAAEETRQREFGRFRQGSLYIFKPEQDTTTMRYPKTVRQLVIRLIYRPWFERTILISTVVNCVLQVLLSNKICENWLHNEGGVNWKGESGVLNVYYPFAQCSERDVKLRAIFLLLFDTAFTIMITVEMILKVIATGLISHKGAYLRTQWTVFEFAMVLVSFARFSPGAANLSILRLIRLIRPLEHGAARVPGMKSVVVTFLRSVQPLASVFLLSCFLCFLAGLMGVELFSGGMRGRCFHEDGSIGRHGDPFDATVTSGLQDLSNPLILCNAGLPGFGRLFQLKNTCPATQSCSVFTNPACIAAGEQLEGSGEICAYNSNPDPTYSMDTLGQAMLTIARTVMLDDWATTMRYLQAGYSAGAALVGFVFLVILGAWFLTFLAISVVQDLYIREIRLEELAAEGKKLADTKQIDIHILHKVQIRVGKFWNAVSTVVHVRFQEYHLYRTIVGWCYIRESTRRRVRMLRRWLRMMTNNHVFDAAIMGVIAANTVIMCFEHFDSSLYEDTLCASLANKLYGTRNCTGPLLSQKWSRPSTLGDDNDEETVRTFCRAAGNASMPCFDSWDRVVERNLTLESVCAGGSCFGMRKELGQTVEALNGIFSTVFGIEMALKIAGHGLVEYCKLPANIFDAFIAISSLVELTDPSGRSGVGALRSFRILRVTRLLRKWPAMQLIIQVIVKALPRAVPLMLLLVLFLFTSAEVGTQILGGEMHAVVCNRQPNLGGGAAVLRSASQGGGAGVESKLARFRNKPSVQQRSLQADELGGLRHNEDINAQESVWIPPNETCEDSLPRTNFDTMFPDKVGYGGVVTVLAMITGQRWSNVVRWGEMVGRGTETIIYGLFVVVIGVWMLISLSIAIMTQTYLQVHKEEKDRATAKSVQKARGFVIRRFAHTVRVVQNLGTPESDAKRPGRKALEKKMAQDFDKALAQHDDSREAANDALSDEANSPRDENPDSGSPGNADGTAASNSLPVIQWSNPDEEDQSPPREWNPIRERAKKFGMWAGRVICRATKRLFWAAKSGVWRMQGFVINLWRQFVDSLPTEQVEEFQKRLLDPRQRVTVFVSHRYFLGFITLCIVVSTIILLSEDPLGPSTECCPSDYVLIRNSSQFFGERDCVRGVDVEETCSGHGTCLGDGTCLCQTKPEQYTASKCQCKWFNSDVCGVRWTFIRHSFSWHVFKSLNYFFIAIFTAEMLAKMFALGVWWSTGVVNEEGVGEKAYLKDGWNVLDGAVVMVSLIVLMMGNSNLAWLRGLRAVRCLRPLRVIRRFAGLRTLVRLLLQCIPHVTRVFLVIVSFVAIFAVLGLHLFAGKFHRCMDASAYPLNPLPSQVFFPVKEVIIPDVLVCIEKGGVWEAPRWTFDNIFEALISMFIVATRDQWVRLMDDAVDATDMGRSPLQMNQPSMSVLFVVYVIVIHCFIMYTLLAAVIQEYLTLKESGLGIISDQQMAWLERMKSEWFTVKKPSSSQRPTPSTAQMSPVAVVSSSPKSPVSPNVLPPPPPPANLPLRRRSVVEDLPSFLVRSSHSGANRGDTEEGMSAGLDLLRLIRVESKPSEEEKHLPNVVEESEKEGVWVGDEGAGDGGSPTTKNAEDAGWSKRKVSVAWEDEGERGCLRSEQADTLVIFPGEADEEEDEGKNVDDGGSEQENGKEGPKSVWAKRRRVTWDRCVVLWGRLRVSMVWVIAQLWFQVLINLCIFLNAIFLAIRTFPQQLHSEASDVADTVFTVIFFFEMVVKLIAMGVLEYISSSWNKFDGAISLLCMMAVIAEGATSVQLPVFTAMRGLRALRILRLMRSAENLKTILFTLILSAPALANVGFLMLLFFLMYVSLGVPLFYNVRWAEEFTGGVDSFANFQGFVNALTTLFAVSTGDGWVTMMQSVMYDDPNYSCELDVNLDGLYTDETGCGSKAAGLLYFISFFCIHNYIIISLIITVLTDSFTTANTTRVKTSSSRAAVEKFAETWRRLDPDQTGTIDAFQLRDLILDAPPKGYEHAMIRCIQLLREATSYMVWVKPDLEAGRKVTLESAFFAINRAAFPDAPLPPAPLLADCVIAEYKKLKKKGFSYYEKQFWTEKKQSSHAARVIQFFFAVIVEKRKLMESIIEENRIEKELREYDSETSLGTIARTDGFVNAGLSLIRRLRYRLGKRKIQEFSQGTYWGVATVTLHQVKNLPETQRAGKCDPFATLTCGCELGDTAGVWATKDRDGNVTEKSNVVLDTYDPEFEEVFTFDVARLSDILTLQIWDDDVVANRPIGSCQVPVCSAAYDPYMVTHQWYGLTGKGDSNAGSVLLTLQTDTFKWAVDIGVVECKYLPSAFISESAFMDSYCVALLGHVALCTTPRHNSFNPVFRERLSFNLADISDTLRIVVLNNKPDADGGDEFVGQAQIAAAQLLHFDNVQMSPVTGLRCPGMWDSDIWLPLTTEDGFTPYGQLTVVVVEARSLPKMNAFGKVDPFCIVRVVLLRKPDKYRGLQTPVRVQTFEPKWDCELSFCAMSKDSDLVIEVYDHNWAGKDEIIGIITLPVANMRSKATDEWYDIKGINMQAGMGEGTLGQVRLITNVQTKDVDYTGTFGYVHLHVQARLLGDVPTLSHMQDAASTIKSSVVDFPPSVVDAHLEIAIIEARDLPNMRSMDGMHALCRVRVAGPHIVFDDETRVVHSMGDLHWIDEFVIKRFEHDANITVTVLETDADEQRLEEIGFVGISVFDLLSRLRRNADPSLIPDGSGVSGERLIEDEWYEVRSMDGTAKVGKLRINFVVGPRESGNAHDDVDQYVTRGLLRDILQEDRAKNDLARREEAVSLAVDAKTRRGVSMGRFSSITESVPPPLPKDGGLRVVGGGMALQRPLQGLKQAGVGRTSTSTPMRALGGMKKEDLVYNDPGVEKLVSKEVELSPTNPKHVIPELGNAFVVYQQDAYR